MLPGDQGAYSGWNNGQGGIWQDSRLRKEVGCTRPVVLDVWAEASQELRMTCSALSKWVEALPFTEIWNRGRQPGLRVEDESDVGYMSWVSCEMSKQRCLLENECVDLALGGEVWAGGGG